MYKIHWGKTVIHVPLGPIGRLFGKRPIAEVSYWGAKMVEHPIRDKIDAKKPKPQY
jgi:hypothetical protein